MRCDCKTGLLTVAAGVTAVGAGLYIAYKMDILDKARLKRRIRKKILTLEKALEDADTYVNRHF